MKKHIISVTEYPVVDIDSVRFLRNIVHQSGTYKLQLTRDPARAQKFGAEAIAVTEWLGKLHGEHKLQRPHLGVMLTFNMVDTK